MNDPEELLKAIKNARDGIRGQIKGVGGELKRRLDTMEIKIDNIERYLAAARDSK